MAWIEKTGQHVWRVRYLRDDGRYGSISGFFARHVAVPCARCGAVREPAARDPDGKPLCPNCLIRDPANLEECVGCGNRTPVAVRLPDGVTP